MPVPWDLSCPETFEPPESATCSRALACLYIRKKSGTKRGTLKSCTPGQSQAAKKILLDKIYLVVKITSVRSEFKCPLGIRRPYGRPQLQE